MSVFSYVAKRFLIAGHSAETSYDLEIPIADYQPSIDVDGSQSFTEGKIGTSLDKAVTIHRFKTIPRDWDQDAEIVEFLMSAMDGHTITFDATGTIASPVNVISGTLKFQKSLKPSTPGHKLRARTFEILEIT